MLILLLPTKPDRIEAILKKKKTIECRREYFCNVDKILFYDLSSKQIVGECEVEERIEGTPDEIWKETKGDSGIDKTKFCDMFGHQIRVYAYKLKNIKKYRKPKELKDIGVGAAPITFRYIRREEI